MEKRIKTGRLQKVTPKEKRNLLRQLKKEGVTSPTAQRESGLTHILRQKRLIMRKEVNSFNI